MGAEPLKVLLVAPAYPYAAHPFAGIFNQRCAAALGRMCEHVEVLSPRPYAPSLIRRLRPRWNAYSQIPRYQRDGDISVYRPVYVQIPGAPSSAWMERITFQASRAVAVARHQYVHFDVILSFDLQGAGSLAWRLARLLRLPAAGWATGDDIRVDPSRAPGRAVLRALRKLDLVFYQSRELFSIGAKLLGVEERDLDPRHHVILSRGVVEPPSMDRREARSRIRRELGLGEDETAVLSLGRITEPKGVYELLAVAARLADTGQRIRLVLVGATPGFDESDKVRRVIEADPALRSRVQLVPACLPVEVWQHLAAADIFAFTSHNEGMPNSLLEAMAMELPVVAFAIPAVVEIDGEGDSVIKVPPFDVGTFAGAILRLATAADERRRRGTQGRAIVRDRFLMQRNMGIALKRLDDGIRIARRDRLRARSVATGGRVG